jgi:NodT family efflux transporter outer membrane factor (OMF) lipoprotein
MRLRKIALLSVSAALLSGCLSVGQPPPLNNADVPAAFEQMASNDAPIWPSPDWWHGFQSPELDGLIATAQAGNLSLAAAEARVVQADARVRQAGASLLPTVGLSADASHSFTPNFSNVGLSLGASYEVDLWNRNRNALAATVASGNATRADRETVALTATAGVANTYFQLLSLRDRLAIAHLNLDTALSVLMVTESRVRNGIATPLELAQQRAAIAGQQAQIPALEQQELQTRAALAVLLGRPPEGFDVTGKEVESLALPEIAPGIPSQLLARRPDVATAEANLYAAHADIAVARAALFPSISLTGSGGLQSTGLTELVTNPINSFSLGASLVQTVFDAGRLQAVTDEARAREQELLANYRNTAITAFSEVETTLGSIGNLAEQEMYLADQVMQSETAFDIANARYREGVADYLTVLDAQRTLYGARDSLSQVRLQRLLAVVALYKALGGGWQNPTPVFANG